jgi:hypothetical protein
MVIRFATLWFGFALGWAVLALRPGAIRRLLADSGDADVSAGA